MWADFPLLSMLVEIVLDYYLMSFVILVSLKVANISTYVDFGERTVERT